MDNLNLYNLFGVVKNQKPKYYAMIRGSEKYPSISGSTTFYDMMGGFWIGINIVGLPINSEPCPTPFFGFHIHKGGDCESKENQYFSNVDGHFNPNDCPHSSHTGDLLPLYARDGFASMYYFISGVNLDELKGKTLIVHRNKDDFTTQPSGNSGEMIACGVIQ